MILISRLIKVGNGGSDVKGTERFCPGFVKIEMLFDFCVGHGSERISGEEKRSVSSCEVLEKGLTQRDNVLFSTLDGQMRNNLIHWRSGQSNDIKERCGCWKFAPEVLSISELVCCVWGFQQNVSCRDKRPTGTNRV